MSDIGYTILCCGTPVIIIIVVTMIVIFAVKKGNRNRLKNQQVEYSNKYKQWSEQGFDLKPLDSGLEKSVNLLEKIKKFKEFDEKIKRLRKLIDELNKLNFNLESHEDLVILLKQPDKLNEIEDYVVKIKDQRAKAIKSQRIEVKNISENLRMKNNKLLAKATDNNNESLLNASTVLSLEMEKLINSYQLGDIKYEEISSELKKMLKQIEILLSGNKGNNRPSNAKENYYEILRVKPNETFENIKTMTLPQSLVQFLS